MEKGAFRSHSLPLPGQACTTQDRSSSLDSSRLQPGQVLKTVNELRSYRKLCDVVLKVDGKEILAHRAILAAVSPYFMAMFTGDMKEASCQEVPIREVSHAVLEQIVDFVYTNHLQVG